MLNIFQFKLLKKLILSTVNPFLMDKANVTTFYEVTLIDGILLCLNIMNYDNYYVCIKNVL